MANRVDSVHYNVPLTNFAIQLPAEQGMIADLICPIVPVKNRSDAYYIFGREELKLDVNPLRADGTAAKELEFSWTSSTYRCEEYAKAAPVTDEEMKNADAIIAPQQTAVSKIVTNIRIWREKRVADLAQTSGNWAANATPSTKWNASSGDIEADINAAKQAMFLKLGLAPNMAVINDKVADAIVAWMRTSGKISMVTIDAWRSLDSNGVMAGEDVRFKGLFGIDRWIVGRAVYDSSARGVAESLARLWGDHCLLLYTNPRPAIKSISAMYTFQSRGYASKTWREEARASLMVETGHVVDEKVTSDLCGYRLYDVIS